LRKATGGKENGISIWKINKLEDMDFVDIQEKQIKYKRPMQAKRG